MPELPEVEIIRRHLDAELRERTIRKARIRRRDLVLNLPTASQPREPSPASWLAAESAASTAAERTSSSASMAKPFFRPRFE
jgi:hypothetical protein